MVDQLITLLLSASLAPEEKAHRKWHCGCRLPRRAHAVCSRHDRLQLPSCLRAGAGWEPLYRAHNVQGANHPPVVLVSQAEGITHYPLMAVSSQLSFKLLRRSQSPSEIGANNVWQLFVLCQQVSVTAREDVPPFGPSLPNPAVFRKVRDRQHRDKYRLEFWHTCQHFYFVSPIFQGCLQAPSCFVVSLRTVRNWQGTQTLLWMVVIHRSVSCLWKTTSTHNPHITYNFNPVRQSTWQPITRFKGRESGCLEAEGPVNLTSCCLGLTNYLHLHFLKVFTNNARLCFEASG